MAQQEVPIFDYRVLSDDGPKPPQPDAEWTEKVWVFVDDWQKGRYLGTVKIKYLKEGPPRFEATFDLNDFESIVVSGSVPGGERWVGRGRARASGRGRPDTDVDIEFRNPKGWG